MKSLLRHPRIALLITLGVCAIPAMAAVVPSQVGPSTVGVPIDIEFSLVPSSPSSLFWVGTGNIPPGLQVVTNSQTFNGRLFGTPNTPGSYNFTVTAYEGSNPVGSANITMVINPPPTFSAAATLPVATLGQPYNAGLGLGGGTQPYVHYYAEGLPNGLTYQETSSGGGGIVGTPTQLGTFDVAAYVLDAVGAANSKSFTLVVQQPTELSILTTSVPNGVVGRAYSASVQANQPVRWSLQGTLPPGIGFTQNTTPSSSTVLSGNPTAAGSYSFSLTAVASCPPAADVCTPQSTSRSYTIVIYPLLSMATPCLSNATVGQGYSASFTASGGTGQYTFTSTTPPPGLTLSNGGSLSGIPTTAGSYDFTVTVRDSAATQFQQTVQHSFSLTVLGPLNTSIGQVPEGTVGIPYGGATITVTGGSAPYAFSVTQGSLPPGLSVNSSGLISGTPTAAGTFNATITARDSVADPCGSATGGRSGSVQVSITVYPVLTLSVPSLSNLVTGQSVSAKLVAAGGKPAYTFAVSQGSLPAGLSLQGDTVTGTPTLAGTTTVTFRVTDALGHTATQPATIIVQSPIKITTTAVPQGTVGTTYLASFDATGGQGRLTWSVSSGSVPGGLSLANTGILTGTPTTAGSSTFSVQVTDANGATDSRQFTLQVFAPLKITTSALTTGTVRSTYEQPLDATGGRNPLVWTASGLPPGLRVDNANASIVGAPTTAGRFSITIGVTDANGAQDARTLTLVVLPNTTDLNIITTAVPNGQLTVPYSFSFSAQGGQTPYTWTSQGGVPDGLTLSNAGVLSGTPTKAGQFSLSVQVADPAGAKASASFTLTIGPAPLTISASLGDGRLGSTYSGNVSASGGTPPYTFTATNGNLPPGVVLSNAGVLSGTPTTAGTFNFTLTVTDSAGQKASTDVTVKIGSIAVTTTSLPNGQIGTAYTASLAATGGQGNLSWTVDSGSLPDGLTLSNGGAISGTPTTSGTFQFRVAVTDSTGARATQGLSITITANIQISPSTLSGPVVSGVAFNQTLTATGGRAPYRFSVSGGSLPDGLSLGSDGTISGTPSAAGSSTVTIRATDAQQNSGTATYTIVVVTKLNLTVSLGSGTVAADYTGSASATGGTAPYRFTATGLPAGLTMDPANGAVTGKPTASGSSPVNVTVTDQSGQTATASATVSVTFPSINNPQVTGVTDRPGPQQQPAVGITIGAPYPVNLSGVLTLTFTSDATIGGDDTAVRFTNGQRTLNFTVPAGSTAAQLVGGNIAVQTGTTAGRITLSGQLLSGAQVVGTFTREVRVDAGPPVITSVRATRTSSGFTVLINGFATSKQVTSARVILTAASGQTLAQTDFTINVDSAFATYYRAASPDNGSTFSVEIPFTVSPSTAVASVSVTLTNSLGSSSSVSATLQ